jgi:hypothetical protein
MDELQALLRKSEALRGAFLKGRTPDSILSQLDELMAGVTILGNSYTSKGVWYRARKCQEGLPYSNLRELIYPPTGALSTGRAHLRGTKALYGGWNLPTALEEVSARPGDELNLITFRVREDRTAHVLAVGMLQHWHMTGRQQGQPGDGSYIEAELRKLPKQQQLATLFVDCFLAEMFRRQVKHDYEYLISACFGNRVLSSGGALTFPSVEAPNALNIAVSGPRFDESFEVTAAIRFKVDAYLGHGIYVPSLLRTCQTFSLNGDIHWEHSYDGLPIRGRYGEVVHAPGTTGWRTSSAG